MFYRILINRIKIILILSMTLVFSGHQAEAIERLNAEAKFMVEFSSMEFDKPKNLSPFWAHVAWYLAAESYRNRLEFSLFAKVIPEPDPNQLIVALKEDKTLIFITAADQIIILKNSQGVTWLVKLSYDAAENPQANWAFEPDDNSDDPIIYQNHYRGEFLPFEPQNMELATHKLAEIKQIGPEYSVWTDFVDHLNPEVIVYPGTFITTTNIQQRTLRLIICLHTLTVEAFRVPNDYILVREKDQILQILLNNCPYTSKPILLIVLPENKRIMLGLDPTQQPCILAPNPSQSEFENNNKYFYYLPLELQSIDPALNMMNKFLEWANP